MSTSSTFSPEYIAEDSKGHSLAKMTAVTVLATLFVILRFAVRVYRKLGFWIDEWSMLASLLFTWGLYAVCILEYRFGGFGKHIAVLDKTNLQAVVNMEIYFFAADYLYATALATAKWSIIAMYWRIFPTRFIRRSAIFLACLVGAWWLGCILVSSFQCNPTRKAWDPLVSGTCLDHTKIFMGKAVPSFSTDFLILLLPVVELTKLHVKTPQKLALCGLFLLGGLACASSVVRFKVIMKMTKQGADATYILPNIMVWTIVEPCAGIISGCLPLLRPFVTVLMDRTGFTRLISSKGGKRSAPSDVVTFGGGGGARKHTGEDAAMLATTDTSMERLRGQPDHPQGDTAGLSLDGYNTNSWRTDVEGGWNTAQRGNMAIPVHAIQVRTSMEMSQHVTGGNEMMERDNRV